MEKSYKKIEAVRKSGEILKYLANQKEPCTGPQIARAASLAIGTTMCHLATLEEIGFVQKVGDYYRIGLGLALIHARVKGNLEGDKMKIESALNELEGGEGHGE